MTFQLISLSGVRQRLPRSRSTIYAEIARGVFPRPLKVGRGSFWRDDEVDDLIAAYAAGASEEDLKGLCGRFYQRRERR
jgi:prophage regulatory protein